MNVSHTIEACKDVYENQNQAADMSGGTEVDNDGKRDKFVKELNESPDDVENCLNLMRKILVNNVMSLTYL